MANRTDMALGSSRNEIVGVVGNVNEFLGQLHPRPHVFQPFLQHPQNTLHLAVRLRKDPSSFAPTLRRAVSSVDRMVAITNVKTMNRVIQAAGQGDDLMAEIMATFAAIALAMAAFGIYGLVSYLIARRNREIGIRVALGASRCGIVTLVLRNSLSLAGIGVAIGFLVSLPLPRLVSSLFSNFVVPGGWIVAGTPALVMLVSLVASYLPARSASRVDPLLALRSE